MSVYPSVGRDWNHELAAFRRPAVLAEPFGGPSWSALEPSDGRDCKFGSIRWPRQQKVIATATCGREELSTGASRRALRDQDAFARLALRGDLRRVALAIAIMQLAANDGNNNRFCTVWNHPMAAHFWKHQLAKTAIGWVE